jgi:hypothetical protein
MSPIKEGDIVHIVYNSGKVLVATVVHVAQATGEFWYFVDSKGTVFAQNPESSNLDKIILARKKNED